MILGLGIDLVDLLRFREQLQDPSSAFVESCFTAAEVRYASDTSARDPAQHLAARYAAKEATLKALDAACALAGCASLLVPLRSIEVQRDEAGRPHLVLHEQAQSLAARVGVDRAHVSLSHDGSQAAAVVILERIV